MPYNWSICSSTAMTQALTFDPGINGNSAAADDIIVHLAFDRWFAFSVLLPLAEASHVHGAFLGDLWLIRRDVCVCVCFVLILWEDSFCIEPLYLNQHFLVCDVIRKNTVRGTTRAYDSDLETLIWLEDAHLLQHSFFILFLSIYWYFLLFLLSAWWV